jgi:hypothetical protein
MRLLLIGKLNSIGDVNMNSFGLLAIAGVGLLISGCSNSTSEATNTVVASDVELSVNLDTTIPFDSSLDKYVITNDDSSDKYIIANDSSLGNGNSLSSDNSLANESSLGSDKDDSTVSIISSDSVGISVPNYLVHISSVDDGGFYEVIADVSDVLDYNQSILLCEDVSKNLIDDGIEYSQLQINIVRGDVSTSYVSQDDGSFILLQ